MGQGATLETMVLLVGACLGGFASGLTGFGYSLVALSIWLHALPPHVAVPLTVLCSTASQALTLPQIWRTIDWRAAAPFLLAGLVGVPAGAAFLAAIDARLFKAALGLFLVAYAVFMLLGNVSWASRWGGRAADVGIGFAGGVLGGLAGLSGSIMVVWAAIRGWGKEEKRAIFQAFNASMLAASAINHAWHGLHSRSVWAATLLAVPLSVAAAWGGHRVYLKLSAQRFDRVVLWLLLFAGIGLLVSPAR